MTALPKTTRKKLGLVIDLDTCVGCHACAVSCKEWNSGGYSAPLTDHNAYGKDPDGVWFNRVHTYETSAAKTSGRTVHFPRACLHCDEPACVTVCPTGASFKREEDGIVLVNPDTCIGCKLCSWACPYGAREYDEDDGIMKKCTLCVDRIYNQNIEPERREPACVSACPTNARHFGDFNDPDSEVSKMTVERGGYDLMPEAGYKPTWKYLPPRSRTSAARPLASPARITPASAGLTPSSSAAPSQTSSAATTTRSQTAPSQTSSAATTTRSQTARSQTSSAATTTRSQTAPDGSESTATAGQQQSLFDRLPQPADAPDGFLGWVDRMLSR